MSRHNDVASLLKEASTAFPDSLKEGINRAFTDSNGVNAFGLAINTHIRFCEDILSTLKDTPLNQSKSGFCSRRLYSVYQTNKALLGLVRSMGVDGINLEIIIASKRLDDVITNIQGVI